MSDLDTEGFSGWRAYIWPVHASELKKLVPMLLLCFLVAFNYNVLRTLKDALVITAKDSGAEVIPFLKLYMMFPMAIAMTGIFAWLSHWYSRERVFYIMFGIFLSYFALFTFVLYPLRHVLHPHEFADRLQVLLPAGFKGGIAMLRYWTFTSFYVMSELWSCIILSVVMWGFANEITKVREAKRFYALFGVGINASGMFAGVVSYKLFQNVYRPFLPFGSDAWEQSLILVTIIIIACGLVSMLAFRWMQKNVMTDAALYTPDESVAAIKGEKPAIPSIREAFRYLLHSRYLAYVAIIVVSYGMVINLVEVVWKYKVRELYPNPSDYNAYMAQVTFWIGVIATSISMFVSGNAIRRLGWTATALMAPAILFITSVLFFGAIFLNGSLSGLAYSLGGLTPLALMVFFGSTQNVLSRTAKYTVYDATKEMAFIPLDRQSKLMGKAAIDGIGSRLGKSGGAITHQILLITCASVGASCPYIAAVLFIVIGIWLAATIKLGKEFRALSEEQAAEALLAQPAREIPIELVEGGQTAS